ncbi:Uncharacterised protein [Vibrio cholerae]|nr:Uncharacterised protein [Vibrio cholerae]
MNFLVVNGSVSRLRVRWCSSLSSYCLMSQPHR